jgi:hypothetical protein
MAEQADVDVARCGAPYCGQPLARAATGRRPRYCSANCRQAARRARVRAEEEAAARAAQLAGARATASRLWRPLEGAAYHDVPDLAALVLSCAADLDRPRAELSDAVSRLDHAAASLARMAREYRDNSELARRLADS